MDKRNDPRTAPHKETCPIKNFVIFVINIVMKLFEVVQNHMLAHLLELCKQELNIDNIPSVYFIDTPITSGAAPSFGEFTDNGIEIVTTGRHPMDVMRTLAHELVHWKQRISGRQMDGSTGSNEENEANAIAGIIMRKFGQMYPEYFTDILS